MSGVVLLCAVVCYVMPLSVIIGTENEILIPIAPMSSKDSDKSANVHRLATAFADQRHTNMDENLGSDILDF